MKRLQRWILPIALGIAGLVLLVQFLTSSAQPGQWSYSDLVSNAQAGRVSEITISGTTGLAIDTSGKKYNGPLRLRGRPRNCSDQLPAQPAHPAPRRRPDLLVLPVHPARTGAGDVLRPLEAAADVA
jgi:hypothetical protein